MNRPYYFRIVDKRKNIEAAYIEDSFFGEVSHFTVSKPLVIKFETINRIMEESINTSMNFGYGKVIVLLNVNYFISEQRYTTPDERKMIREYIGEKLLSIHGIDIYLAELDSNLVVQGVLVR